MKKSNQLRSIGSVMLLMLVGKLLSLLANQVYLSYFGADSEQLNIFSWVLQIPNYLFQSLGTGLCSTFIPLFAALLAQKKLEEANRFGSNILCITLCGTAMLVALGWAISPLLPGLTDFSDKAYALQSLLIIMPVMLFYALTNIYQGILQSMDRHLSAALVNLPSGIVILLYIALGADRFGVTGLLLTVVFGLFLQFAVLPLPAHRAGFRFHPVLDLRDPQIRTVGRMMLPTILGASAYHFNMFFNNTMMSAVEPGSVTLFNFVQTLIITSVMTLVLAITSVKYPALTVCVANEDMPGFRRELSGTMGGMIYLLTPITFGLICLGHPLLELISLHGRVIPENIDTEAAFLTMYSLCIVFLGLKEIADRALYSLRITRISAWVGVVIMSVNILCGWLLSRLTPLGAAGIPLGYSLGVIAGTVWLLSRLKGKISFFGGDLKATAVKSILGAMIMSAAVLAAHRSLSIPFGSGSILHRIILVLLPTVIGMAVYFAVTYLLKATPIHSFIQSILNRDSR